MKAEAGHKVDGRWIKMPLADALTPKSGRICYGPSYWMLTGDDELLFYERYTSPQCNTNKALCERWMASTGRFAPPAAKIKFLEIVYLPHNPNDY